MSKNAFEAHPKLAAYIEQLANLGVPGWSMQDWQGFTDAVNGAVAHAPTPDGDKMIQRAIGRQEGHDQCRKEVLAALDSGIPRQSVASPSTATNVEPVAYWFEHPTNGMDLSTDPLSSTAESLGWTSQPLYAAPPSPDAVREALELLVKYADWQISEGGSHHPTLRGAIGKARAALSGAPTPSAATTDEPDTLCEVCSKPGATHHAVFDGFACAECQASWTEKSEASE